MALELENIELENTPRFRNFDWEKAKNFYYVAKFGSFVSAARFLNISQSALSRQVIHLEQHLGCPLFSRHSGGVKLTRKGEELFAIVETTFVGLKGFTRNAHAKIANGGKRKIRISSTHADAAYILNDLILDYSKQHSELVFEMISNDQLIDIVLNDVDIAIRPYDPEARGVLQEVLFTLEKKLYASAEYIEKYGVPQTIEELNNHRIIAPANPEDYPYSELNWILKLGMRDGKFHDPVYTSNSIECLIGAAKKGVGIIAGYAKMTILKNANLINILPNVIHKEQKGCFICPDYLKKDKDIMGIKDFLQQKLN